MSSAELQAELVAASESLAAPDTRWQIAEDWRETLLGPTVLRWEQWRQAGQIQIIKQGAHRTVYRIALPERRFYLKHYHPEGFSAVVANRLRGSAAWRELRNANELRRRGLSTAEPIGMGERGGRESFFVTRAIENAQTIDEFSKSDGTEAGETPAAIARRRVIVALAEFCAATHRAGVEHADFHCGNVLIEVDHARLHNRAAALPRLYWIDLPKMRFSGPLDWRRSCASLAILTSGWLHRTTRTERQRFWNAYLAGRGDLLLLDARAAMTEIIQAARIHSQRILAGRDKRALATNRDFVRVSGAEYTAHAAQGATPQDLDQWIERALAESGAPAARRKGAKTILVSRAEWTVAGASQAIDIQVIPPRQNLLRSLGRTPTFEKWRLANALRTRRIDTPRPLFAIQPRDRRRPGLLVTEAGAATPLDELLPGPAEAAEAFGNETHRNPLRLEPKARHAIAIAVGRLLGDLHAWNFTLPSAGAAAISVSGLATAAGSARPTAWLNKLDGVALRQRLTEKNRALDLQLFLDSMILCRPSRTDCLRAVQAYLVSALQPGEEWKGIWRDVYVGSIFEEIVDSQRQRRAERAEEEVAS